MTVTQTDIQGLFSGSKVFCLNRADLPFEEMFASVEDGADAVFSEEQMKERIHFILSRPDISLAWKATTETKTEALRENLTRSSAWVYSCATEQPCSQETTERGHHIFGHWFDDYPKPNREISFAIVAPDSPYLKSSVYVESGMRAFLRHTNPDLDIRHEIGHLLYGTYAHNMTKSLLYFNEARADGFMAVTHLSSDSSSCHNGRIAEVQEWIHKRRMDAFFNLMPSEYWTAAAIEATLQKARIPNWMDNFYTIRGLQIRVLDTLLAEKAGEQNEKAYSTRESDNLLNYTGHLDRDDLSVSHKYIPELRDVFPAQKIVSTLAHVLETHHLKSTTRDEGEKIICAYNYFCPTRPVSWPDVTGGTPQNNFLPSLFKDKAEHLSSGCAFIRNNALHHQIAVCL